MIPPQLSRVATWGLVKCVGRALTGTFTAGLVGHAARAAGGEVRTRKRIAARTAERTWRGRMATSVRDMPDSAGRRGAARAVRERTGPFIERKCRAGAKPNTLSRRRSQ